MAARNLLVLLNDYPVGMLTNLLDGRTVFAFDGDYLADSDRPTLSLSFKNVFSNISTAHDVVSPSGRLPPFFSHLLPEGQLRTYLANRAAVRERHEFPLLAALSDDLPGAVLLRSDDTYRDENTHLVEHHAESTAGEERLRFSLAGVQLKFSGELVDSKIVIPARGVGGHWIVKLPSPAYSYVNELEYSMLRLAAKMGLNVPEFRLAPLSNIENFPKDLPASMSGNCLLSKRFDRTAGGGRIHMEDFAQVFSIYEKYDGRYNYQSIAYVLWLESGLEDVLEFVGRLVHTFAIGNADMHTKNWALVYPDGRSARLSPAYDLVSTIVYPNIVRRLPHKMADTREFNRIGVEEFRKFARIARLPERAVVKAAYEAVEAVKESWRKLRNELPVPEQFKRSIEDHMKSVPLLNERADFKS